MTQLPENNRNGLPPNQGGAPNIGSQETRPQGVPSLPVSQPQQSRLSKGPAEKQAPSPVLMRRDSKSEPGYQFTDQRIIQQLEVAIASSETFETLLGNISRIVTAQSDCLALWVCQRTDAENFGEPHLLTEEGGALWVVVDDHANEMIRRVATTRQICSSPLRSRTTTELVVGPIVLSKDQDAPVPMMMIGCFSSENQSVLRQQWLVGMVSQSMARWQQFQALGSLESKTKSLHDTIGLVHALDQTESVSGASMVVVNHLRRMCDAEQVAIALRDGKNSLKVHAVSDVEKIDAHSEANKVITNACNQAILTGEVLQYPPPEDEHSPAMLALDKYCKSNNIESCIGLPLKNDDGETFGSLLLGINEPEKKHPQFNEYLSRMVTLTSGHLGVVMRANQGLRDLSKKRWRTFRSAWLTKFVAAIAACLAALMFVPWQYRVACECEIQPVLRRFVAAPYDGILEKSLVESGDIVEPDQLVAHLDGAQLRIELSGLRADYAGAEKRKKSALAKRETGASNIARSEMRRYQAKIDILQAQLENLEVRSPVAGIVVSGDLEKVEGAPVEMGKTLFEIAPLDNMLAEIGIPESEIQYAKPGQTVSIKLNAFPFKTWTGTIEKIHPSSEIIESESVFVAQVRLNNQEDQLRPGMQGSAKISTHYSPIGWNLFHQSWEKIRYWLIW